MVDASVHDFCFTTGPRSLGCTVRNGTPAASVSRDSSNGAPRDAYTPRHFGRQPVSFAVRADSTVAFLSEVMPKAGLPERSMETVARTGLACRAGSVALIADWRPSKEDGSFV